MKTAIAERGRCAPSGRPNGAEPLDGPAILMRLELPAPDAGRGPSGSVFVMPGRVRECSVEVGPTGNVSLDFALVAAPGLVAPEPIPPLEHLADGPAEYQAANGWRAVASNVDRSPDGRFEIETSGRQAYTARDRWTGEEVRGLAVRSSAEQWCRVRKPAGALKWSGSADRVEARNESGERFEVSAVGGDLFIATDGRFPEGSVRRSSLHDTPELAKHWCEVRSVCVVEGGVTLRYESPIPF